MIGIGTKLEVQAYGAVFTYRLSGRGHGGWAWQCELWEKTEGMPGLIRFRSVLATGTERKTCGSPQLTLLETLQRGSDWKNDDRLRVQPSGRKRAVHNLPVQKGNSGEPRTS